MIELQLMLLVTIFCLCLTAAIVRDNQKKIEKLEEINARTKANTND